MKEYHIKVSDHPNLVRDKRSQAIVSTDRNAYNEYIRQREYALSEKEKVDSLRSELNDVKNEISEIKDLLLKIANKPT
tara:strand:+ start:152 stop:385 length:234 start_codon:yes stop_codon:yes gene_type:complete